MKLLKWFAASCLAFCAALSASFAQAVLPSAAAQQLRSRIFIYDLRDGSSKLVFTADTIWEAPSWSPDGKYLISNSGGAIYRLTLKTDDTATPQRLAIPEEYKCNNDKAISPDGKLLGFSATLAPAKSSNVYLAHPDGSNIRAMTTEAPSYFHGWSPNGKVMAYVAGRNGSKQFHIYTVPVTGGAEKQLTSGSSYDDGPDYSPDGKWVYINSNRSGHYSIWRFPAAGAGVGDASAEMVLADGEEDWFPHISPDGKKLVYIAYPAGTPSHNPRTVHVELKLSRSSNDNFDKQPVPLTGFTGGQGSLNVNSWAPDSQRFAYVSYEVIP